MIPAICDVRKKDLAKKEISEVLVIWTTLY